MTEWNAAGYERISALQQKMASEALALTQFKGFERVLDVGCGSGRVTAGLASLVPDGEVLGVDASSEMIAFASQAAEAAGLKNLHYAVADARRLEFDAEFDAIVSFNALHWIPQQESALRGLHKALKPHGWAHIRLVTRGQRVSLEDTLEAVARSERWADYFRDHVDPYLHLTASEYGSLAERCGFVVDNSRVYDETWDFLSHENFQNFLRVTTVAWTAKLPSSETAAFLDDVLARYRTVACSQLGEEYLFRFYQMDLRLTHRP
jgi:trans-aconitate methyltransferase